MLGVFISIQSVIIFITLLLGVLLIGIPKAKKQQNLPISLFLFAIGILISLDLLVEMPMFHQNEFLALPSICVFLFGPFWYWHTLAITNRQLGKSIGIHFLPFFCFFLLFFFFGYDYPVFWILYALQYTYYGVIITRLVRSDALVDHKTKKWVLSFGYSFGLIWLMAFAAKITGTFGYENGADLIEMISFLFTIGFVSVFFYFLFVHINLFINIRISTSNKERLVEDMSEQETHRMQKLEHLFVEKKIHRNPKVNREQLAATLGLDVQTFSREVNQYFKTNLPDLINTYRIKEAQLLLQEGDLTMKEVYHQVGFSSRSVFNTAFKKMVGTSPTDFKKSDRI